MAGVSRLLLQAGGTLSVVSHLPGMAGGTATSRSPTSGLADESVKLIAFHWRLVHCAHASDQEALRALGTAR